MWLSARFLATVPKPFLVLTAKQLRWVNRFGDYAFAKDREEGKAVVEAE